MKPSWKTNPTPGKSMLNIDLGIGYIEVLSRIKIHEKSDGTIKFENSLPMRLDISSNKQIIRLRSLEDFNYDWQSNVAILFFRNEILTSITANLNEPYSYSGLICGKVGLGDEIRDLEDYFSIKYDDVDEVFYALNGEQPIGLELHGASCDLTIDPTQKIGAMRVFLIDNHGSP
jgi:hypothetical protein